ncbi:MAG: phenylacetic acid degradation protein PaaB [Thermomicrobiaceae bacterium]|nr:phenylacetic acid degradation protein PaaB [Thermomicrobiaceae bacterium]
MRVYEVFRQEEEGEAMRHVGNVDAPDDELALQYAREVYSRRGEATRLWVVPREAILEIVDPDFLRPPLDHSYRMGEAYRVTVMKRRQITGREAARDA